MVRGETPQSRGFQGDAEPEGGIFHRLGDFSVKMDFPDEKFNALVKSRQIIWIRLREMEVFFRDLHFVKSFGPFDQNIGGASACQLNIYRRPSRYFYIAGERVTFLKPDSRKRFIIVIFEK
jgi:hypothetical protein